MRDMGIYDVLGYAIEALSTIAHSLVTIAQEAADNQQVLGGDQADDADSLGAEEALDREIDSVERLSAPEYVKPESWSTMSDWDKVIDITTFYLSRGDVLRSLSHIEPLGYTLELIDDEWIIIAIGR